MTSQPIYTDPMERMHPYATQEPDGDLIYNLKLMASDLIGMMKAQGAPKNEFFQHMEELWDSIEAEFVGRRR